MKLSTRETIAAPAAHVFASVSDFEHFERLLSARGARVSRQSDELAPTQTSGWVVEMDLHGQQRRIVSDLTAFEIDGGYTVVSLVSGLRCVTTVDLTAMAPAKTRLHVAVDLRPETLKGRLLLQPIKLAKSSLRARFAARVARYAQDIAAGYAG